MDTGLIEIFRGAGFEWEEIGWAKSATICIFSFVRVLGQGAAVWKDDEL